MTDDTEEDQDLVEFLKDVLTDALVDGCEPHEIAAEIGEIWGWFIGMTLLTHGDKLAFELEGIRVRHAVEATTAECSGRSRVPDATHTSSPARH